MLYDINASMMLLGGFANSPHLITSKKYKISNGDFICKSCADAKFHNIIYRCMYNIVVQGAEEIDSVTIDMFLQNYPVQYEICKEFDFMNFISTIKDIASEKNIDYYYDIVRKFGLLRRYKEAGYDVSPIYDELKSDDEQQKKLSKYSIKDISQHFKSLQQEIDREYVDSEQITHYKIGSAMKETKESFKANPVIGLAYSSPILNKVNNGIEGLVLRSAESGAGKTTMSVSDACMSGVEYYYDKTQNDFIKNESYVGNVLFINTEMDIYKELDPLFTAWVADVPRNRIRAGEYQGNQEARVDKAIEIVGKSIYSVTDPDFTCSSLEETIDDYVKHKNIKLVVFDYIQYQHYVAAELAKLNDMALREDIVLLQITDRLKNLSLKYDIPILSSTQLNRKAQEERNPDESWLAGGISQVRKVNTSMVMTTLKKKDMADIEPYLCQLEGDIKPNVCTHIIKTRNSEFSKGTRVYQYNDLGTGRVTDLFCTTKDLDPLPIQGLKIKCTKD